jgi:plasmid stability protein
MPDVLIRNIDKETLDRLKERAKNNNRSLQEELKELVEFHAKPDISETRDRVHEILVKYKASGKSFPDSGDELSKDRER